MKSLKHLMVAFCKVCGDRASGRHYGVPSCDGCRGFFKRCVRRDLRFRCKDNQNCVVDVARRNQCQFCRFQKCLQVNMRREAVQHERVSANKNRKSKRTSASAQVQDRALADSTTPGSSSGTSANLTALSTLVPRSTSLGQRPLSYPSGWLNGTTSSTLQAAVTSGGLDSPESACPRLLFSAVSWALSIPAFQALQPSDQQLLLEESLLELMVVTALQFRGDASSAVVQGQLTCFIGLSESAKLEELIKCMSSFSPPLNQLEFTSLKALLLFKPECTGLSDWRQVSAMQDHIVSLLYEQSSTSSATCSPPLRFGRLLLFLSMARRLTRASNFLPIHASLFALYPLCPV